jgi:CRISPR-associated exonuclease Cas4
MDGIILIALALLGLGVVLLMLKRRGQEAIGMPEGEPIYMDTTEEPGKILRSQRYGLSGKPDFLLRQGSSIVPVEAKTGKTPRQPQPGHVLQLMAYCVLVEENYGVRPEYGIVRYTEQQFVVEFTPEREQELLAVLWEMQQAQMQDEVYRTHRHPGRCAACGYRNRCDQRLDI